MSEIDRLRAAVEAMTAGPWEARGSSATATAHARFNRRNGADLPVSRITPLWEHAPAHEARR